METIIRESDAFKYNLSRRLDKAGRRRALSIRRQIMNKHQVSASTYHRWLNLKADDTGDIPGIVLLCFAKLLEVQADQLLAKPTGNE